jgi:putative Mg2+ transporter-C (MgtC) family protein
VEPTAEFWNIAARLTVATLAGAVFGWEREWSDKPAGLKTHMLVSLGAGLFMCAGLQYVEAKHAAGITDIDPMRVLQGIVGGIGFLGAGSIIQSGGQVRGLTTAASIWTAAGFGVAAALGYFKMVLITIILGLAVLVAIDAIEHRIFANRRARIGKRSESE